ncbi:MAG: thioredoxin family protein, partial [Terriglobales bacterium]
IRYRTAFIALFLLSLPMTAQDFAPLERWKAAVLSGDDAALRALYSANPPADIQNPKKQPIPLADELRFWEGLKGQGLSAMKIEIAKLEPGPFAGSQLVAFETELRLKTSSGFKTEYVIQTQVWQTGAAPSIVAAVRGDPRRLKQPLKLNPNLYNPQADAKLEIKEALERAARTHKNVILVFGGNWCYDCHVLDLAFHHPEIEPTLKAHFLVVHVDVGEYDKNLDLAEQYQVPLKKGVPALAVLASDGKLLYSQRGGEFEAARSLAPEDVVAFLKKWQPAMK